MTLRGTSFSMANVAFMAEADQGRIFGLDAQLLFDILIQGLAVFLLFLFLSYILIEPVKKVIADRQAKIKGDLDSAARDKEEAAKLKAEYDEKLKKAEYMEAHLGEVFEGVVSGITQWGIYVELPNTVEGLIHVAKIPGDYYYYNESTYERVGEATGKTFKLGMKVKVKATATDTFAKTIDFALAGEDE